MKDLQVLQNKAARIVTNSPFRTNRNKFFDEIDWLTVRQQVHYHTLLTVYRIRQTQQPVYLASLLCRDNYFGKIIVPGFKLKIYRKSFVYRGVCNWNDLPPEIRNIANIGTFKKKIKMWIKKDVPIFLD